MTKEFYYYEITSDYGKRNDPFTGVETNHNGIDYGVPLNTNINSVTGGSVVTSSYNDSYGNYVVVKDGKGRLHYYAHLNERSVNVGDTVSKGDLLGLSGSTGRSTGAHVHYEVRKADGTTTNPKLYIMDSVDSFTEFANQNLGLDADYDIINGDSEIPWYDIKGKTMETVKNVVGVCLKYIVIILLIVLAVILLTKALDIEII